MKETEIDEFIEGLKEAHNAQCVGCSFCCSKAPCGVALRVHGPVTTCPSLKFNTEQARWFCELCMLPGELGAGYRKELSVGAGCCSPMFNDWRKNIPKPKIETPKQELEKQLRVFLHSMGRIGFGCNPDFLWLAVKNTAKALGYGKEWEDACFKAIKEERSKESNEFMGVIEETKRV